MPSYVINMESLAAQGPFKTNKETVKNVARIDEDVLSDFIVVEIGELGTINVENAEDWLGDNDEEDDESES